MKLNIFARELLRCFTFLSLFAVLCYINFFIVIDFDLQQLPDNYLSLLVYDLVYMGLLTAILMLSKPLSQGNHRQLILLFLFTALLEYLLYVRLVYAFIDYFYIAIWFNSILSFVSFYIVSKRENMSVWVLTQLLKFRFCQQWAVSRIDKIYLTEFDFHISRVLFIIFIANFLGDAWCAATAWMLAVPWFGGSLALAIEQGGFDVYLFTEVIVNGLILLLMLYLIWRLALANRHLQVGKKQSTSGGTLNIEPQR